MITEEYTGNSKIDFPIFRLKILTFLEKANALKQDLLQFITADEMQIAVVLDATNSMRLVWDKLVFGNSFTNIILLGS